jgi:hypothetical protein
MAQLNLREVDTQPSNSHHTESKHYERLSDISETNASEKEIDICKPCVVVVVVVVVVVHLGKCAR